MPILSNTQRAALQQQATVLLVAFILAAGPVIGGPNAAKPRQGQAGQTLSAPGVVALIRKMLRAQNSLILEGVMVSQTPQGTFTQHVILDGARAQRYECLSPAQNRGEVIVDDGRARYHSTPAGRIDVMPSQMSARRVRVPQVMREIRQGSLRTSVVGQAVIAGQECEIIRIAPPYSAEWYQYWIDPTNGAQLRIEQYSASGQRESSSYFTQVTYNPVLNPHIFAPPASAAATPHSSQPSTMVTVPTLAQAGFQVLQPSYLPAGFHFQSSTLSLLSGQPLVKLTYGNGLNALTLVETPDPHHQGPDAGLMRIPRPGLVITRRNGLVIVLVGSLEPGILENVLNSVH